MSKELEVSLVNYLCPVCGNIAEEGIIMNSLLSEEAAKEVKSLHGKTVGYSDHACKECAKYKDEALFIIGIDAEKSEKEPWRTGDITGINKDCPLALHIKQLLRDRWKLRCLEMAGVDNWTWYDQAMSDYEADEYTNDELTKDYNEAN